MNKRDNTSAHPALGSYFALWVLHWTRNPAAWVQFRSPTLTPPPPTHPTNMQPSAAGLRALWTNQIADAITQTPSHTHILHATSASHGRLSLNNPQAKRLDVSPRCEVVKWHSAVALRSSHLGLHGDKHKQNTFRYGNNNANRTVYLIIVIVRRNWDNSHITYDASKRHQRSEESTIESRVRKLFWNTDSTPLNYFRQTKVIKIELREFPPH